MVHDILLRKKIKHIEMTTCQQDETWHYQISRFKLYKGTPNVRDAYNIWVRRHFREFLMGYERGSRKKDLEEFKWWYRKKIEALEWMKPKHVGSDGQSAFEEPVKRCWGTPSYNEEGVGPSYNISININESYCQIWSTVCQN